MKIIFVLISIFITQNIFGQEKPNYICSDCRSLAQPILVPKPEYPKDARSSGIKGTVKIQVSIDENGNVIEAKMLEGDKIFEENAVKAAMLAKFKPSKYFSNGQSVKSFGVLVYNFVLDEEIEAENDFTLSLGILNEKASILQMPKYPTADAEVSGTVNVETKIDLQKGEVVSAKAISGHPLLRIEAEKAALQTKFPPTLMEFLDVFGRGFLIYKIEDFNGKTIENKNPKWLISIIEKGVVNDRAKSLPKPKFPYGGKNAFGFVKVWILVDMSGKVLLAKAVSGHPLLRPFSEDAARETRFAPTLINGGEPFYVKAYLLYKFNSDHTVETDFKDNDFVLGSPIKLPKPPFPSFSGKVGSKKPQVFVQIEIDENGNVTFAKGIAGHPVLRAACEVAARSSKFSQTKVKGVPVKAKAVLLYEFNLDDDSKKVELKSIEAMKPE